MYSYNPYDETKHVPISVSLSRDINKRADDYESKDNVYLMNSHDVCTELEKIYQTWTSETPVFINAGTGAGKTTFAIKYVAKYAKLRKKNVLFVSNRVGIERQIKNILIREYKNKIIFDMGEEESGRFYQIGNVIIANYQSVGAVLNKVEEYQISHVFFDEAHFFVADSLFVDNTWALLNRMVLCASNVVRIYMSATAWGAIDVISKAETELHNRKVLDNLKRELKQARTLGYSPRRKYQAEHGRLTEYRFPRKEEKINLIPLSAEVRDKNCEQLLQYIKSAKTDEKWMIFVNSKTQGKWLKEEVEKELGDGTVTYVDATQKNSIAWKKLVMESTFETRMLIATSVADCGMNVLDSQVKHIVIFSTERSQFIQMLGRKRMQEGETINLYVPDYTLKQMAWEENSNRKLANATNMFRKYAKDRKKFENDLCTLRQEIWRNGDSNMRHLFDLEWRSGVLTMNECANEYVWFRQAFFEDLRGRFENGAKAPFLEKAAGWLKLPDPEFEVELSDEEKRELAKEFLRNYKGEELLGEDKKAFSNKLWAYFSELFGPREGMNKSRVEKDGIKYDSLKKWINDLDLGFVLKGGRKDTEGWIVVETKK